MVLLGFLAAACSAEGEPPDDMVCTEEARASVMVAVADGAGAPLPGALVTYRVDGGPSLVAECADPGLPAGACALFVAGYEVAGEFTLRAEKGGFRPVEATTTVRRDASGCHVITRQVTLALVP